MGAIKELPCAFRHHGHVDIMSKMFIHLFADFLHRLILQSGYLDIKTKICNPYLMIGMHMCTIKRHGNPKDRQRI